MIIKKLSLLVFLLGFVISCTKREVGDKNRPFQIYFLPAIDSEQLSVAGKAL